MGVDGRAAEHTMLNYGSWRSGYCLECVWNAYKDNGARTDGGSYPTAYSAWLASKTQHPGDRNPPEGVPVFWGPKSSSSAGDVVISRGDGTVVATDWPSAGRIGTPTLDQRQNQIGRPYLGWTEDICGAPISFGEENDMDSNQAWQLQALYNLLLFFEDGSPKYAWSQAALNEISATHTDLGGVQKGGILYPGANYYAFTALANNQAAMSEALNKIMDSLKITGPRVDPPSAPPAPEPECAAPFVPEGDAGEPPHDATEVDTANGQGDHHGGLNPAAER